MHTYALFDNGTAEQVIIKLLNVEVKETLDIYLQSFRSPKVKESARRGIECAYEVIFSKDFKAYIQKTPISVTVKDFTRQVDGNSAGLAYSVAFASALQKGGIIKTSFDLPEIIAATGEVDIMGNVRRINNLREKILGAISKNVKLLFYPDENNEEIKILLDQDKAFRTDVKNSGIKLKDVASIEQLFCEMGILPGTKQEEKNSVSGYTGNDVPKNYTCYAGIAGYGLGGILKSNIFKALWVLLAAVIMCIPIYRSHVLSAASTSVNLAYKKIVYASSDENIENSSANAVDGNEGTRWSSEYSDRQWIYVDLGKIQDVSSVILYWETAYAKQYQIQVSCDGFTWAVVYTESNNEGGENVVNFNTVQARYIKMYAWQRGTRYGYSLWEFEVYGNNQPQPGMQPSQDTIESDTAVNTQLYADSHKLDENIKINRPFPQRLNYKGCIKPDNVTQEQMENTIKKFYDYWKAMYVKFSNGRTPGGGYYVEIKGNTSDGNDKTVSSVHGYGMIIFALMAGYDKQAKQYFDGMYNMYDKHRSTINSNNMSWIIDQTEDESKDSDSSTDGDLDIAYALLLANRQWGSEGKIDYNSEAKKIITKGIKRSEISHSTMRPLLGDWDENQNATRITDLMTDHFHAFWIATGDSFWKDVMDNTYDLVPKIIDKFSPDTGLLPDFVTGNPVRPAAPDSVEGPMDNGYGWNSCYYPLRMAADFAHYGSSNSKGVCSKILEWLKNTTNNNPANIKTCYSLDGFAKDDISSIKFTAPLIAACIVDKANQSYLDAGWNKISTWKEKCDGDSINLLSMLLISGNWWVPA